MFRIIPKTKNIGISITLLYSHTEIEDWNAVAIECSLLASKWMSLGAYLGCSIALIDQIKSEYSNDSKSCLNEVLKHWIQQNYDSKRYGAPSWRRLLKAIALVNKLQFMKLASRHQGRHFLVLNSYLICALTL